MPPAGRPLGPCACRRLSEAVNPIMISGDGLRLGVRRHRLFESNLPLIGTLCWHDRAAAPVGVYGTYGQHAGGKPAATQPSVSTQDARAAIGIDWMPWPDLTQAIPPAHTHWIGVQVFGPSTRFRHRPCSNGLPHGWRLTAPSRLKRPRLRASCPEPRRSYSGWSGPCRTERRLGPAGLAYPASGSGGSGLPPAPRHDGPRHW